MRNCSSGEVGNQSELEALSFEEERKFLFLITGAPQLVQPW